MLRIYIDGELDVERSFESAEDEDDWVLRLGQGFRGFPSPRSDFQGSIESAKIWNGRVLAFSEILEEVPMVEIEEKEFEMKEEEQEKRQGRRRSRGDNDRPRQHLGEQRAPRVLTQRPPLR